MTTSFDEVHDLMLLSIKDYNLDKLYTTSASDFYNFLDGIIIKSIPFFTNCQKDLTDYDLSKREFNVDLNLQEKVILSNLEIITWMDKQILDITQFSLFLNDTDFKTYSQAQNLKSKQDSQNILREKVNQDMSNYGLRNVPWSEWANGTFFNE